MGMGEWGDACSWPISPWTLANTEHMASKHWTHVIIIKSFSLNFS